MQLYDRGGDRVRRLVAIADDETLLRAPSDRVVAQRASIQSACLRDRGHRLGVLRLRVEQQV